MAMNLQWPLDRYPPIIKPDAKTTWISAALLRWLVEQKRKAS